MSEPGGRQLLGAKVPSVPCRPVTTPTLERRRHQRYPATFKVRCSRIGREAEPDEVDAVDVSRSGLRMIAPRGVAAGDVLSLVLNPAQPVHTTGIVVTCRPAFDVRGRREAHIAFTKVTADVERELDRLIATARGDHGAGPETSGDVRRGQ
jgi:PilZ domain-containing protein